MTNSSIKVIGLMSGTSLDGLDIAYCEFFKNNQKWNFTIGTTQTISFEEKWITQLTEAGNLSGLGLIQLHKDFGEWIGYQTKYFIKQNNLQPDIIASHGHTIFHEPDKGITFQLGNGVNIAAVTGVDVISDFRSLDVALGGQGAPLVPIGDKLLFGGYDYCLNLGGFANISLDHNSERVSYDVCPCNMALNFLASKKGLAYDKNGTMARKGRINEKLLHSLNDLPFYKKSYPKSLGREWFENNFLPYLKQENISIEDLLSTIVDHIALQVGSAPDINNGKKLLISGGGTHNQFLIEEISKKTGAEIIIPSPKIIDFKEALIFGFLGALRSNNEVNCLKSVTGSKTNNSGGIITKAPSS